MTQKKKTFVSISIDGRLKTFDGDFDLNKITKAQIVSSSAKRVSYILPENLFLRILFRTIRSLVKDESKAAEWTRKWKCTWYVHILPTNEKFYGFKNREDAIIFEREYIVKLLLSQKSQANSSN